MRTLGLADPAFIGGMGGGVQLWTPAAMTTALWLDAADANTITIVSGAVSQWNDKSGNSRHATQALVSNMPGYSGNRINFNGTTSLSCTPGWGNFWEWLLVLKFDRTNILQVPARDSLTTSGTAIIGYVNLSASFYRARNTSNSYAGSIDNEFGTTTRIHGFSSRTTNQAFAFVDGIQKTSWSVSGSMGSTLILGVNGTLGGNGLVGSMCEFILLPSEADNFTRQRLEGYLAHKWGLTANLPNDHPYKSAAPTV